jgi:D-methionine transport system ATP-binding protein
MAFTLESGEFVGVVGVSGAGKTSLFRLLNRLQDPSNGQILFQGRPLTEFGVPQLRQQVMLVSQEVRLLGMTVAEALAYPLHLQGVPETDRANRIEPWLSRCQIDPAWLPRPEVELSGGQRQRVAIARALIANPTVLLLDEPTSAQDVGSATRLLEMIHQRVKETGLTVLMSNHQLEWVERFCDRVLHLHQGRLVGNWPIADVNWSALRNALVTATTTEANDWGEADP